MAQYDYRSVGASVSDALRQAVAQREAERRQAMLDEFNIKQETAREARLAQSAKEQSEYQQASLRSIDDQRNQNQLLNAEKIKTEQATRAGKTRRVGDRITKAEAPDVPAEMREDRMTIGGRSLALPIQGMTPGGPGIVQGPMTTPQSLPQAKTEDFTYIGNAEQRAQEEIMNDPNFDPRLKQLGMLKAAGMDTGGAAAMLAKDDTSKETRGLAVQAADALARGDTATYERLKRVQKEMGQADDRPININAQDNTRFNQEQRLVTQWDRERRSYSEMRRQMLIMDSGINRIAEDPAGASQAVLVTFQKILDPLSVVREGEYARTSQSLPMDSRIQGWLAKYAGQYDPQTGKWIGNGTGVPVQDLRAMVETAREWFKASEGVTSGVRRRITDTAAQYKLDPRNIFDDTVMPSGSGSSNGGQDAASRAAAAIARARARTP